ncbi:hypothetical protein AX17_001114 [Amanita inopinata Kibby_2008]|nr:hypothetical protein AX17_001114 [Amanita inopinata Kibby_2008]
MSLPSDALYQPVPDDSTITDTEEDAQTEPTVLDERFKWTFFMMGCALLVPWNVIITAVPFFLSRLEGAPRLKLSFSSYLTTSSTIVNFAFLTHATFYDKPSPPSRQIRSTILALAALSLMLTFCTLIRVSPGFFATFVLLNATAQAIVCAYFQKALIAVGSLFGPTALQPIMSGQAAVAVAVSAVQVMSAATSLWGLPREAIAAYVSDGSAEGRSAFIFFAFSTLFLAFCALVHGWLVRTPLYQRIAAPLEQSGKGIYSGSDADERRSLVSAEGSEMFNKNSQIVRVAKANVIYEFAVAYVFLITLSVFPPITTSILPISPDIHPLLFSSIHFLVFNIGDFLGRYLCSFPRLLIWSAKRLLVLSLLRTAFIPLFLMCNVQRPSTSINLPPVINSDLLYMLILLAFGISNGYLGSMCMISAPSLEHNPRLSRKEDVDVVATVTNFSLVGGLSIGSAASFAVKAAICGCNPFTG